MTSIWSGVETFFLIVAGHCNRSWRHIATSILINIGSVDGLSLYRHQAATLSVNLFALSLRNLVKKCWMRKIADMLSPQSLATVFIIILITRKGAGRCKHENDNKNSGKRLWQWTFGRPSSLDFPKFGRRFQASEWDMSFLIAGEW